MMFRFDEFADAARAEAAFQAAFPLGSPVKPALQALVDMGAQCSNAGPGRAACRYVEKTRILAGWCWHIAVESDSDNTIRRAAVTLSILGM
jgi:hypothetical protein